MLVGSCLSSKRELPNQRAYIHLWQHIDEGVGVDEEGIYFDTDSLVAASDSSYDSDLAASSDSCDDCSDPEFNPDALMCSCKDVGLTLPWMPHT